MGLFDIFGKNEFKEKISALEKEIKQLEQELREERNTHFIKISQLENLLCEKDEIIVNQKQLLNDCNKTNAILNKFVELCDTPKSASLIFDEQNCDNSCFLDDIAIFEKFLAKFDCCDELFQVSGTAHNNTPWSVKLWVTNIRIEHNNYDVEEVKNRELICEIPPNTHKDVIFCLLQSDLDKVLEPYHDEIDYHDRDECCQKISFKFILECNNCTIGTCDFVIPESCINIYEYEELLNSLLEDNVCTSNGIIYIYKGNIRCHRYCHHIIQATAVLHDKTDNEIELNVEYCTECKKFLLEYSIFEQYRNRYGVLIGNFRMVVTGEFDGEYDLAEESPLMLSGYNVSQRDGYTSNERQYILARIIHDDIMDKGDVIRYLSYFIRKNGAKRGNELALSKWKEDLAFVQDYNKNIQPRAIITNIKKY